MSGNLYMGIEEACRITNMARWTMGEYCRKGEIVAAKPRGRRGGWMLMRPSFDQWWAARIGKTDNSKARKTTR